MQDAHTPHIWIYANSNFLQLHILAYIFSQCQWAMSMEPILTYKNVALKIHGCHKPHGTKYVLGECTIECLNIGRNYTPYKSIQDHLI